MNDASNLPRPTMPAESLSTAGNSAPNASGSQTMNVQQPQSNQSNQPAQPQSGSIQSPLMRNLQSVSAAPFQDPTQQQTSPAFDASSSTSSNTPGNTPAQNQSTPSPSAAPQSVSQVIPQESANMSGASPQSNGGNDSNGSSGSSSSGKTPVGGSAAKLGFFSKMGKGIWIAAVAVVLLLVGGGALAWTMWLQPESTPVVNNANTGEGAAPASQQVELTYWGLWEPEEVMQPLIDAYEQQNPGVTITYEQQTSRQYRQRLQTALQQGTGPDIFRYHNTWIPMFRDQLSAAPNQTISAQDLQQNFYPIMSRELTVNGKVMGVPLMYEGLALLYNKSIMDSANALPPADWNELRQLANQLTIRQGSRIERAGIALGTAENVDHYSDILGLMMLQNGANPGNPTTENAQHALEFYTLFSRTDNVWDTTFPASTVAFANEQAVMIFAPSWRIYDIQQLNPNIEIGVAQVPQLGGEDITWGTFWVEGVSKKSEHSQEAWEFLSYLSEAEQLREFHSQAASLRGYGELYPRVDMADDLRDNPQLSPYLEDALYAYSWYMAGATHDDGINDQIIEYYTDAINRMRDTGQAQQALQSIVPGLQQVLSRFGVSLTGAEQPAANQAAPPTL